MFDDFFLLVLCAGVGIAFTAGAVGSFVVWRRMAYFGDSLAHNALLGVAFGMLVGINTHISVLLASVLFATLLFLLQYKRVVTTDTALGVLSHVALAAGLIVLAVFLPNIAIESYLFGELLTVQTEHLYFIYGVFLLTLVVLLRYWQSMLLTTLNEDLARAEGISVVWMHWLLVLLITLLVAVAIRIVGVLLVTSLLIIPAASARQLVNTPLAMMCVASLLGASAVAFGIVVSFYFDAPSGPSIVMVASGLFAVAVIVSSVRK